jgi:hypothetical protein
LRQESFKSHKTNFSLGLGKPWWLGESSHLLLELHLLLHELDVLLLPHQLLIDLLLLLW